MIEETRLYTEKKLYYSKRSEAVLRALKRHHISAEYIADGKDVAPRVLELVPDGAIVAYGDSVTLHQLGVYDAFIERGTNEILDPFKRNKDGNLAITGEERLAVMRKAFTADYFITGSNAITQDGKIVNIDGAGNRVSAMIFGPKKVIILVGANKITKNVDEALKRIKDYAAPINVQRHYSKHGANSFDLPCRHTGYCVDCLSPNRICNYTVIIEGEKGPLTSVGYLPRLHVIIVCEELGI